MDGLESQPGHWSVLLVEIEKIKSLYGTIVLVYYTPLIEYSELSILTLSSRVLQ